jgi:hypothetical protein
MIYRAEVDCWVATVSNRSGRKLWKRFFLLEAESIHDVEKAARALAEANNNFRLYVAVEYRGAHSVTLPSELQVKQGPAQESSQK